MSLLGKVSTAVSLEIFRITGIDFWYPKKSHEQWPVHPGSLLYITDEILPTLRRKYFVSHKIRIPWSWSNEYFMVHVRIECCCLFKWIWVHQIWSSFFFAEGHRIQSIQSIQHHRLSVESSDQLWRFIARRFYNHQTKTGWKLRGSKVAELVLPTKKCWWENLFQPFLTIQLMIISQLLLSDHFWCVSFVTFSGVKMVKSDHHLRVIKRTLEQCSFHPGWWFDIGDEILPNYMEIIISQYKDTY